MSVEDAAAAMCSERPPCAACRAAAEAFYERRLAAREEASHATRLRDAEREHVRGVPEYRPERSEP